MSRKINGNTNIKGQNRGGEEIKQTLFADDASFTLDGTEQSFKELVRTIEQFANVSGLKLNKGKCTILKLGTIRHNKNKWCNNNLYTCSNEQASTLGITFTNDKTKLQLLNLIPQIKSFQNCINSWKKWNLTLIGKIAVLKNICIP